MHVLWYESVNFESPGISGLARCSPPFKDAGPGGLPQMLDKQESPIQNYLPLSALCLVIHPFQALPFPEMILPGIPYEVVTLWL